MLILLRSSMRKGLLLTEKDVHQHANDEHGHDAEEEEVAKGPHGGRLLSSEGFDLEITIFERGLPPEFRVYAYLDEQAVPVEKVKLDTRIVLHRTGLSPEDMAVIRQSKEYGPIPREQEVCELEVGGQVIARGRIIRKKGAWYFKVRETAEKARKRRRK